MNTLVEPSVRQLIEEALTGAHGWQPTEGPWFGHFNCVTQSPRYGEGMRICDSSGTRGKTEAEHANNDYIASVNPAAIRQLLAEHDALTQSQAAEIERLREALEPFANIVVNAPGEIVPNGYASPSEWRADVANARRALTQQPTKE